MRREMGKNGCFPSQLAPLSHALSQVSDVWKATLSHKIVNNYREFLTNTIQLAELRKRFEVYTGPVKNTGGVP